jgi:formamidopyrimidine-DNA glycosylase
VPELPEVETVVRDLRPYLVGRQFISVAAGRRHLRRRWRRAWAPVLIGRRIEEVRRRGKWIVIGLDADLSLVVHLGMTGRLTMARPDEPLAKHTHLVWGLDPGNSQLRFNDIRRFGSATLYSTSNDLEKFFAGMRLGPEPFILDGKYWLRSLTKTSRCLKAVLLDQRVVAGVGNIYADESLFLARLHPTRLGREVSAAEATRLKKAIIRVLTRAIEKRGSSIRNYVGGSGQRGAYQDEFRVYGQTGCPCPHCGTRIDDMRLAGRATHFCPQCQPLVRKEV